MSLESIREKMLSGKLYDPYDKDLAPFQLAQIQNINEFNNTPSTLDGLKKREEIIRRSFKKVGKNFYIEPPLHANMGGAHTTIGDNFYSNFNLTLVDDGEIQIGNNVMIAPNVTIITANHPFSIEYRKKGYQYNKKVVIKDNAWIGACSTILSGVTIGENSIVGASSLVTKDVPDNVIVMGSPARIYKRITKEDELIYDHDKRIGDK